MSSLLLTGGTGFLGSNLLRRLVAEDLDVVLLKRAQSNLARIQNLLPKVKICDLADGPMERIFDENRVDTILHCATHYGRRGTPTDILETNIILPLRLLQIASERGARCFLNTDTILDKRVSEYSLSKRQFVEWLDLFGARLVCVSVALEHFYGPHDDPSKFLSGIIRDLLLGVDRIELTPGAQKRDFIHVDDVVDAFMKILQFSTGAKPGSYRFEVATNAPVTIREVVEEVHRLAGHPGTVLDFGALPYRENEVMDSVVDTAALRAIGWKPQIALRDGLRRTVEAEREKMAHA
jgi:CDP-paratose synthetase